MYQLRQREPNQSQPELRLLRQALSQWPSIRNARADVTHLESTGLARKDQYAVPSKLPETVSMRRADARAIPTAPRTPFCQILQLRHRHRRARLRDKDVAAPSTQAGVASMQYMQSAR